MLMQKSIQCIDLQAVEMLHEHDDRGTIIIERATEHLFEDRTISVFHIPLHTSQGCLGAGLQSYPGLPPAGVHENFHPHGGP